MESEHFYQLDMPCIDCLVAAICKDKPTETTFKHGVFPMVLAIKKWDESKKVYRKGLIECWANLGWKIFSHMRTSEFRELPDEITPEFLDVLIEMANTIQYIINSTS